MEEEIMASLDEIAAKYSGGAVAQDTGDPMDALAAKVNAYYEQAPKTVVGATPVPAAPPVNMPQLSRMDKVKRGVVDPIEGAAQLLYNVLPESIQNLGNRANNWLAENTGLVGKLPEAGLNEAIKRSEGDYQASRAAQGDTGIDWWRAGGNVLSPANLAIAAKAMTLAKPVASVAGKTAGNMVAGATGAAAQGAIAPVSSPDYWGDKGTQVGLVAAIGGALPILGKLLPKNTAAASELKAAGVDVPVGQAMGGLAKSIEDKLTSWPLLGDAINSARRNSVNQFNIATLNKALAPIGESLPKGTQAGHEAISLAGQKVSAAYNAILPKLNVKQDTQFLRDMTQLKQMAANLPDAEMNQFKRIIANEVEGKFTPAGLMSGETMKQVESKLGQLARGYGRSEGYEKQQLADAIFQAQSNLRSMVERNNPMYAPILQKINQSFAALIRPERAAAYVGAENGVFTPAQLLSAVKGADSSLRHKAFAKGDALMQGWAETGKGTLSSKTPDSGTAGRLMAGAGLGGGIGYISPEAAIAAALATASYLPGGRQVASGLLGASQGAANVVSNRAPYAATLAAPIAYGLLQ